MSLPILQELRALGVEVIPDGESLLIRPASKVPPELKERLRAAKREVLAALAPAECRHCEGAGECDCPACTLRRTDRPVPCLMCKPEKRQIWLAATRPEGCWHCAGTGTCGCIGCERAGVCTVCGGSAKERVQ
jgi:hypothetical protein